MFLLKKVLFCSRAWARQTAAAPLTISASSCVIAACLALL
jgi:hypothetical protein